MDFPAVETEKREQVQRDVAGRGNYKIKQAVYFFLHAGKPTATITSVWLEVRDADGGS